MYAMWIGTNMHAWDESLVILVILLVGNFYLITCAHVNRSVVSARQNSMQDKSVMQTDAMDGL